jgi:hypothetical protein
MTLALAMFMTLAFTGFLHAEYLTRQISINPLYDDVNPRINNSGQAVWIGNDENDDEIYFFNGVVTQRLTNDNLDVGAPEINDSGWLVWYGSDGGGDWEIFLYDGTSTTQLTNNSFYDSYPKINANGWVTWLGTYTPFAHQVYLYNGTEVQRITSSSYSSENVQINDNGWVVWDRNGQVWLFDGTQIVQISESGGTNPRINNNGWIVWQGTEPEGQQIYLYDGSAITLLMDPPAIEAGDARINDNGYVVWSARPQSTGTSYWRIFLYDGQSTIVLTDGQSNALYPEINNNGMVVWRGANDEHTSTEIYLADAENIVRLTNNNFADEFPQINNLGQVVWQAQVDDADYEIMLATEQAPGWGVGSTVEGTPPVGGSFRAANWLFLLLVPFGMLARRVLRPLKNG